MIIGDRYNTNNYGELEVIGYVNANNVLVRFADTGCYRSATADHIRNGKVKDYYKPNVYGVGYIGVGAYKSSTHPHAYKCWTRMMARCYCQDYQKRNKTYIGCKVSEHWHNFQNFAEWFYDNYDDGLHLDKDILGDGKLYSEKTCKFVTQYENVNHALSMNYKFISPDGSIVEIYNLAEFCRNNGLSNSCMGAVWNGTRNKHKGWTRCDSD